MSSNWVQDIFDMQDKYGVRKWVLDPENKDRLRLYLDFRIQFLREELEETESAMVSSDNEEIVDGLIDLCVADVGGNIRDNDADLGIGFAGKIDFSIYNQMLINRIVSTQLE